MVSSPSVVAAATTLAEWARERRRGWSDIPLEVPQVAQAVVDVMPEPMPSEMVAAVAVVPDSVVGEMWVDDTSIEDISVDVVHDVPDVPDVPDVAPGVARPSIGAIAFTGLKACASASAKFVAGTIAWLASLGEPAAQWLLRGAALVSVMSVVMFAGINRAQFVDRWDRVAAMAVAAANRPAPTPAAPAGPPAGTGRITVAASEGSAQVLIDGTPRGAAPLTVDLPAGAHRVLLRSPSGSVERAVRIRAGESSEMTESIFPGWVALVTPIDLSLSEGGQPLKRDERGWAILPPGPHDILLDNRTLGIHEVRHVVVTPGGTTRLSFMPHASTISLTTNEVADVWIDGASFGQAPLVDQPIAVGVHDIRVRSALHERWVRVRATVQPVQINVDLTAQ